MDCTPLLTELVPTPTKVIDIPYSYGAGSAATMKLNTIDFFKEDPITNCAILNCNYGDTCDEASSILEPDSNIVFSVQDVPTSTFTLEYKQDFKNGYGPHDLCLRCRVTNDELDDFTFSIQ